MALLQELLAEEAAERAEVAASEARIADFYAGFLKLAKPERRKLLVILLKHAEWERGKIDVEELAGFLGGGEPTRIVLPPKDVEPDANFVTKCEAVLAEHPEGLTTSEISEAIGQDIKATDSTVRWLQRKTDGGVARRGGRWFLLRREKKKQLRDHIREAITAAGRPLGSGDILAAVRKQKSDANKGSIGSELNRMQKHGVLVAISGGPRGGKAYKLPDGGEPRKG